MRFTQLATTRWPFLFLALTLLMTVIMQRVGPQPSIVGFELAGSLDKADALLRQWGEAGRQQAIRQTYLDFLFILLYAPTFALFCRRVARGQTGFWEQLGLGLGWLMLTAGMLDVVENLAMLKTLHGSRADLYPTLAFYCASGKFLLLLTGAIYLLTGSIRKWWMG